MMHICPRCETPLAQSEVGLEYTDVTDISVTAKFELVDEPGTYVLAWTTTPWTLPGNTALAIHKDILYVKVKSVKDEVVSMYILAKSKFEEYFKDIDSKEIVSECTGEELIGKAYVPVFPYFKKSSLENKERIWKIWHADFITEDAGTGIAHEAPAFGAEDMELAKAHAIPVIKHVKMDGAFTDEVADFKGMKVKVAGDTQSADIEIIKWLAHNGKLFEKHKIIHSYPLCWRCKTPLLNYATSSWFVDVPKIKETLLSENKKIGWTPEHIRDGRFGKWLEGAREWAVSRSRYWGAPLPVWKNKDGSKVKIIGSLNELAALNKQQPKNVYYAMRHGESVFNIKDKLDALGDKDNVLTDKGIEEVVHAAKKVKELGVDVIIASPLIRTQETAKIISQETGIAFYTDESLREFDFGEYKDMKASEFRAIKSIHSNLYEKVPGGESFKCGAHRFMQAVMQTEAQYEGKTILFISHGSNVYMGTHEAELSTDEETIAGGNQNHGINVVNAQIVPFSPKIVPRDATGAINLHRPYIDEIVLSVDGEDYTRIGDVFDCWFESGSMPFASIHYPFENKIIFERDYPAQFIAESMDQTRGWFYSLINLGVGLFEKAPYRHVICNGLINAADGKKLSKSLGNYTDPMALIDMYGADAFRYYLMSSPVIKGENVNFNDKDVEDVYKKCIGRLENVVMLYEMNKDIEVIPSQASDVVLDQWMISKINALVHDATVGYENYCLDDATRGIATTIDDISVWYTRRSRERLKGDDGAEEKEKAYETLSYVLITLAKVMAPVMPFMAERVYRQLGGPKESVHLESWPEGGVIDEHLIKEMERVRAMVSLGLMKRTEHKINVKQPLSSATFITHIDQKYHTLILDELNIKQIIVDETQDEEVVLDTVITEDLQKEGDIRILIRAIQNTRKEKGLLPSDEVMLRISSRVVLDGDTQLMITCKITSIEEDSSITANPVELSTSTLYFEIK
jgi:isoleucyl-tRNA synthetase